MSAFYGLTSAANPLLASATTQVVVMNQYDRNVVLSEASRSGCTDVLLLTKPRTRVSLLDPERNARGFRIFYPDWGSMGYTSTLAEARDIDPISTSDPKRAFVQLAISARHGKLPQGNLIPIPYGSVMQIGALSVATLLSDRLRSSRINYIPPWIRDVDILLLSGTLTHPEALSDFIKKQRGPGPLLSFYPRNQDYTADRKEWNTWPSHMIGLGPSTQYHALASYQTKPQHPGKPLKDRLDFSIHSSPMRDPSKWANTTKTHKKEHEIVNKEKRFQLTLTVRYKREISDRLMNFFSIDTDTSVARARADYASNQTGRLVAKYLAFLERNPGHSQTERSAYLEGLYDDMHSSARAVWQSPAATHDTEILRTVDRKQFPRDWVQAFALYLELWFYENTNHAGPYR